MIYVGFVAVFILGLMIGRQVRDAEVRDAYLRGLGDGASIDISMGSCDNEDQREVVN